MVGELDIDHNFIVSKTCCKALNVSNHHAQAQSPLIPLRHGSGWREMPQAQKPVEKPHPARDEKPAEKPHPPPARVTAATKPDWMAFWMAVRPLNLSKEFINTEASSFFNCSIQEVSD